MGTLDNRQIHYRCAFRIRAVQPLARQSIRGWGDLVKVIRHWISKNRNNKNVNTEALFKGWFFEGGEWATHYNRIIVITRREIGNGSDRVPQYWAVRYEHPCSEMSFRQWRTDIGITALSECNFFISVVVSYIILPEYLGEEPSVPISTAPWLLQFLLDPEKWECYAGSHRLSNEAIRLKVNMGLEFYNALKDTERKCPIILVSRDRETQEPKIDANRLAKVLLGTAVIYVNSDSGVEQELDYFILKDYRCQNGAVRIYWPNLSFETANDYKRHRYFSPEKIDDLSQLGIQDIIVQAIARRYRCEDPHIVATLEDVATKARESRIRTLREAGQSTQELIQLEEEEIKVLNAKISTLELENNSLWSDFEDIDSDVEDLKHSLRASKITAVYTRQECDALRDEISMLRTKTELLDQLDHLPESLSDVLDLIGQLYPEKIVFTESALDSAHDANFSNLQIAWRCLWSMATILHALYFKEQDSSNIETFFQEQSGFELALTEGKLTKRDKKLMSAREQKYKGEVIDITPHVKYGDKPPNCLRIHYHAHLREKKIIVGHCGNHLETSGTRRRG